MREQLETTGGGAVGRLPGNVGEKEEEEGGGGGARSYKEARCIGHGKSGATTPFLR